MKHEVIVMKSHRSRYDQGILVAGGRLVEAGTTDLVYPEQIERAITEKTAFLFYLAEAEAERGSLPLSLLAGICGPKKIPIVVDAAAELPPQRNFTAYIKSGADLVIFSGGKDIAGPQSSGLILGRRDLIEACRANSCPNHSVGRAMKVDKENLAGLLKAVELYVKTDFSEKEKLWNESADKLRIGLASIDGLEVEKAFPIEPGIQPQRIPKVFAAPKEGSSISAVLLAQKLEAGNPAIIAGMYRGKLMLNPQCLRKGEEEIIVRRIACIMRGSDE
jgi:seryl-tRNA(Sec) selenium transferase